MASQILFLALLTSNIENKHTFQECKDSNHFLKDTPSGGLIGGHRIQETMVNKEVSKRRIKSKQFKMFL